MLSFNSYANLKSFPIKKPLLLVLTTRVKRIIIEPKLYINNQDFELSGYFHLFPQEELEIYNDDHYLA